MKYDNLFDYDFIREMRDNFDIENGHHFRRAFVIPEEEVDPEEEIHPILGMLGVVDNEEDLIEDDVPEEDENFFDEQYDYLYEIDNLFNYERINDEDTFILLIEDINF